MPFIWLWSYWLLIHTLYTWLSKKQKNTGPQNCSGMEKWSTGLTDTVWDALATHSMWRKNFIRKQSLSISPVLAVDWEEAEPISMFDTILKTLAITLACQWANDHIIYRQSYLLPTNPRYTGSKTSRGLDFCYSEYIHTVSQWLFLPK